MTGKFAKQCAVPDCVAPAIPLLKDFNIRNEWLKLIFNKLLDHVQV